MHDPRIVGHRNYILLDMKGITISAKQLPYPFFLGQGITIRAKQTVTGEFRPSGNTNAQQRMEEFTVEKIFSFFQKNICWFEIKELTL